VWAMIYAHFCGSWGHYTCLSWLPTFFRFGTLRFPPLSYFIGLRERDHCWNRIWWIYSTLF